MENKDEHIVAELICAKCLHRWIAVFPAEVMLIDIECPGCGETGYAINTGQEIKGEPICHSCYMYAAGRCKLNITPAESDYCDYFK